MKKTLIIGAILALGGALSACDDPVEEQREEMEERREERQEAASEALEEMAEGAGEANAALRGENEIVQEVEGMRAEEAMEDSIEEHAEAMEEE